MQSGIVQKIFSDHFDQYGQDRLLSRRERKAAWAIMTCRTEDQGYHINECPNGDYREVVFNSCKHRSCPQCGAIDTQLWLEHRRAQALDCPYYHIIFTISHDLHNLWRFNRKVFTGIMMRACWHSLRELLLDWRYLGALVGAVGVFQSWDDEMRDHCHAHFIVSAGGLNEDDRWVSAAKTYLLPTPVLAAKFRGKFIAYLKEGFCRYTTTGKEKKDNRILHPPAGQSLQQCLNLLNKLGRKRWHVEIEPAYEHANGVIKYVGRYIRRGPISQKRIIRYDGKEVEIAYAHREKHSAPTFTLSAQQFIRRLLSHVPYKGTHVVRAYGLFHHNLRAKLDLARKQLGQGPYVPSSQPSGAMEILQRMFPNRQLGRCPHCLRRLRTVFVYRGSQASFVKLAA